MHAAAYALDPEFQQHDLRHNTEVNDGLKKMVRKLLADKPGAYNKALSQLTDYRNKTGAFSEHENPEMWDAVRDMPAWRWWQTHCDGAPELQYVAMHILAQPTASSPCERSWSAFDFIHNKRRNRLKPARVEKLVFVFSNMQLLRCRLRRASYENIPWQHAEDSSASEDDEA